MSDDEVLFVIIFIIISSIFWYRWYYYIIKMENFFKNSIVKIWLTLLPLIVLSGIFIVLKIGSSFDVRNSNVYLFFYLVFGLFWIAMNLYIYERLFNISYRDDAMERNNSAAVFIVTGVVIGSAACYSGANIGNGPGWWCVLFSGFLAMSFWLLHWFILELIFSFQEAITVERDVSCGIRLCFYLISSGIICGRGAAGDWFSFSRTFWEFSSAWPVSVITLIAGITEQITNHKLKEEYGEKKSLRDAVFIGLIYLSISILAVVFSSSLSQNPFYSLNKESF